MNGPERLRRNVEEMKAPGFFTRNLPSEGDALFSTTPKVSER